MCRTLQHKTCIICTGIVWLASPAAIALSVLCANVAICNLAAWSIHNMYKKHKTYPEGKTICHPSSSPVSPLGHMIYNDAYILKWKLRLSLQGPFRE